jgi:hypothetical protein
MPEISRFFGIVIQMYYNDHDPPTFTCDTRLKGRWWLSKICRFCAGT